MFKALDDIYESGVAEGRKLGQKEAEARGERRGEKRGEERFAALSERLLRDARMEDLKRAIGDREYRGRLYREYRLR